MDGRELSRIVGWLAIGTALLLGMCFPIGILLPAHVYAQEPPREVIAAQADTDSQKPDNKPLSVDASHAAEAKEAAEKAEDLAELARLESEIRTRIARTQENSELAPEVRSEAVETLQTALESLNVARIHLDERWDFVRKARTAPQDTIDARKKRETKLPDAKSRVNETDELSKLQDDLALAEEELRTKRDELETAENENQVRSDQKLIINRRLSELHEELNEIDKELERGTDANVAEVKQTADELLLRTRRRSAVAERDKMQKQLITYELTEDLIAIQRDIASTERDFALEYRDALEEAVDRKRRSEVDRDIEEAQGRAKTAEPHFQSIAERNVASTQQRKSLASRMESLRERIDKAEQTSRELDAEFEKVVERTRRSGFTETVAVVLRRRRDALPNVAVLNEDGRRREHETSQLNLQLAELEEQRSGLASIDSASERIVSSLFQSGSTPTPKQQEDLEQLLRDQRRYLDGLISDTSHYLDLLLELESLERQLIHQSQEYAQFCDEHVLWIRSTVPPNTADVPRIGQAIREVFAPSLWSIRLEGLKSVFVSQPEMSAVVIALCVFGLYWSKRSERRLRQMATQQPIGTKLAPLSLQVVLTSVFPIPLLLWFVGWRMGAIHLDDSWSAAGRAFETVAWLLIPLRTIRLGSRLNHIHPQLAWHSTALIQGSRDFCRGATLWGLPLLWFALWGVNIAGDPVRGPFGRLAFVLLQGVLWWRIRRLVQSVRTTPSSDLQNWRRFSVQITSSTAVIAPILFAILSIWGYHYTAVQIEVRLFGLLGLWGFLVVLEQLCKCWLIPATQQSSPLTHKDGVTTSSNGPGLPRNLLNATPANQSPAVDQQTKQSTNQQLVENGKPASPDVETPDDSTTVPQTIPTLKGSIYQTQHLIQVAKIALFLVAAWLICDRILPAFRVFENVELWPHPFRLIDNGTDGPTEGVVTLAGLAMALTFGLLTWLIERTVPELIDVSFLSRTRLDPGARYAVAAIFRYAIVLLGVLAAFSQLGIGWAQLNWLVAAMTVGLGFGLQEIFANFVSGLILLFERPVRIGDIVSIGDITGSVSRIRMRATTITDGELRELLVPNKELITGRVINWTLSNTLSRITLKLKTAIGTDPDVARGLLLAVANKHRQVLKAPPPSAQFEDFAENCLNFTLRVCVPSCDVTSQVRHELLTMIKREFQQAGIVTVIPASKPVTPAIQ